MAPTARQATRTIPVTPHAEWEQLLGPYIEAAVRRGREKDEHIIGGAVSHVKFRAKAHPVTNQHEEHGIMALAVALLNEARGYGRPQPPPAAPISLIEFGAFVQHVHDDPEPPFVIEDFIPHNGLVIVGGQPKTMKTLAVVQMGVTAAAGHPFLGRQTNTPTAFVYVTEEGTRTMHADRIEQYLVANPEARGRCHIVYRQQVRLAVLDNLKQAIRDLIAAHGTALVVIDPLRDYMPSGRSEKDDDAIATVKAYLRQWLTEEPRLTVGLVHHVVKDDSGRQGDARALSGSGAIYAMADATVMWYAKKSGLNGESDDDPADAPLIQIAGVGGHCIVESRARPPVRIDWVYDPVSGLVVEGSASDASMAARVLAVLDGHDISTEGLYGALRVSNREKGAVRAATSRLAKKGQISQSPAGFWTRKLLAVGETYPRTLMLEDEPAREAARTRTDRLLEAHEDPYHPARGLPEV